MAILFSKKIQSDRLIILLIIKFYRKNILVQEQGQIFLDFIGTQISVSTGVFELNCM